MALDMSALAAALDENDWEWLDANVPRVARAVLDLVVKGATPEELEEFVAGYAGQPDLARAVKLAASHLMAARGEGDG
jgi:hypothetical protein